MTFDRHWRTSICTAAVVVVLGIVCFPGLANSIVRDGDKFRSHVISDPVRVVRSVDTNADEEPTAALVNDPFYDGCGVRKTCFGAPSGCLATQDCTAVVTVRKQEIYVFELKAKNVAYVAVGLSDDRKMGGDSVMECVHESGINQVKAYMSWNIPNKKANKRLTTQNGFLMLNSSFNDGTITCSVDRDELTQIEGVDFDLKNKKYFLLLAAGMKLKKEGVGYHDVVYSATAEATLLWKVETLKSASMALVTFHGSFMILAWIGAASVGIVIARYYKKTWVGVSFCSKDMWFGWHRLLMISTCVLTVAGSVCIYAEVGGWVSDDNSRKHAIMGLITTVLALFQPIYAAFRPSTDSSSRSMFNWTHWLVGNAAHIFSIITILLASGLGKAKLPEWTKWIIVMYAVFYAAVHVILTWLSKKSENTNAFPMNEIQKDRITEIHVDTPNSEQRKLWLCIHVLFTVIITLFLMFLVIFYSL